MASSIGSVFFLSRAWNASKQSSHLHHSQSSWTHNVLVIAFLARRRTYIISPRVVRNHGRDVAIMQHKESNNIQKLVPLWSETLQSRFHPNRPRPRQQPARESEQGMFVAIQGGRWWMIAVRRMHNATSDMLIATCTKNTPHLVCCTRLHGGANRMSLRSCVCLLPCFSIHLLRAYGQGRPSSSQVPPCRCVHLHLRQTIRKYPSGPWSGMSSHVCAIN